MVSWWTARIPMRREIAEQLLDLNIYLEIEAAVSKKKSFLVYDER